MNKPKGGKVAAVIDIGSSLVKMQVCQVQNKQIAKLDQLERPLRLGHEVFHGGKISFESLKELIEILHDFRKVMEEYSVEEYQVVATTAMREARNKDFIIDQLRIQNHMPVEILEDNQEKNLMYYEIVKALQKYHQEKSVSLGNTLIAHIGTGSIGMCVYNGQHLIFSQNISIGSLKLHDIWGDIQDDTEDFDIVVEEYLDAVIGRIPMPLSKDQIDSLVITGNEIPLITKLCDVSADNGVYRMKAATLTDLFEIIRKMTPEKIGFRYDIPEERAETLYSALAIYARLLKLTQSHVVLSPQIELWDPILKQMLFQKTAGEYADYAEDNALTCARTFADRYHCKKQHADQVTALASKIFDRMKRIHGLSPRHRMILELAAILHDCGYFVDSKYHSESAFDLIQNLDICGVTYEEMRMTAYVSRFNERESPNFDDLEFLHIHEEQKLVCSKLAAIFRLANALDKSQKQKLRDIKIKLEEDRLLISGTSDQNLRLEQWAFELCSPFFKEVFGIQPCFAVKSRML